MKITQESWNVLVDPRVPIIPTSKELFDFYIEKLRVSGIITNPDEFRNLQKSLPKFGPFILVPQNNLSLDELMVRVVVDDLGGKNSLNDRYVKDIIKTPRRHYLAIDIEDGRQMLNISSKSAIKAFSKNKRLVLTVKEGIFMAIYFPEIIKRHSIDLLGSRYDSDCVPSLYLIGGKPRLNWDCLGNASSSWGAASCGSRIGL